MASPTGLAYLIIGAGVFGASTALHLRKTDPKAQVTLLDRTPFPNPSAASHDLNKIVRADYFDIFYTKLALEAHDLWRKDDIYKPYYHETGMVFASDQKWSSVAVDNYKTLGVDTGGQILDADGVRASFPTFKDANLDGMGSAFYNPKSGWAEADVALKSTIQAAVDISVIYVENTMQKLVIGPNDVCTGVQLEFGKVMSADNGILCTGARTAKLLADTDPTNNRLQVEGRVFAAGVVQCCVSVDIEPQDNALREAPVIANVLAHTTGETIPMTKDGKLKCNQEASFTNMVHHEGLDKKISIPPENVRATTWGKEVPERLKRECEKVLNNTYGANRRGFQFESYRLCWDAVTPDQDFIIDAHPAAKNLYVAVGGSFHGWKFLPILGKYVAKMIKGDLDEEMRAKWAWDRQSSEHSANSVCWPKRDLSDVE